MVGTPVRAKLQRNPKPDGGVRTLSVPVATDRLLQQAVSQVFMLIHEPMFSDSSFGFRPNRSAQDAILRAKSYIDEGYAYAVDLDLSKFFDTLNQEILTDVIRETLKDKALIELIKRFVKADAVLADGLRVGTEEGTTHGVPLRPILANTHLDRFDKLMERYGNRIGEAFVIHSKDLRVDGNIVYVPIYMMPFIKWK